jgi:CBS domain-containing protein
MSSTDAGPIESTPSRLHAVGSFRLPCLAHARVDDAMRPGVISVAPDTPLRELARVLSTRHIHCLVVTNPSGENAAPRWGLISSFDLVLATLNDAADSFENRTASELGSATPPT